MSRIHNSHKFKDYHFIIKNINLMFMLYNSAVLKYIILRGIFYRILYL